MDWFTSDWHLGHTNIIKYCDRPFKSVDEMDAAIINNINAVVGQDDRLFNMGDVAFKGALEKIYSYRERIVCKNVFVIPGNHDKANSLRNRFTVLPAEYMYSDGGYRLVLNHYAMRVWPHSHHGAGHLYGHSHGKLTPMVTTEGFGAMAFDVGVDCWDYKPLSLDQVKKEMERLSSTKMSGQIINPIDDHHRPR